MNQNNKPVPSKTQKQAMLAAQKIQRVKYEDACKWCNVENVAHGEDPNFVVRWETKEGNWDSVVIDYKPEGE